MTEEEFASKRKRMREGKDAGMKNQAPTGSEHTEQVNFFKWWWDYADAFKLSRKLCFAIPNASALSGAGRVYKWAEGLTAGVYDVFLSIPRGPYHGLYIEFKRPDGTNGPTDAQNAFRDAVIPMGYRAAVCYTAKQAVNLAEEYLRQNP